MTALWCSPREAIRPPLENRPPKWSQRRCRQRQPADFLRATPLFVSPRAPLRIDGCVADLDHAESLVCWFDKRAARLKVFANRAGRRQLTKIQAHPRLDSAIKGQPQPSAADLLVQSLEPAVLALIAQERRLFGKLPRRL